jgi:hypothetical protein
MRTVLKCTTFWVERGFSPAKEATLTNRLYSLLKNSLIGERNVLGNQFCLSVSRSRSSNVRNNREAQEPLAHAHASCRRVMRTRL